jgi:hypothetical protein
MSLFKSKQPARRERRYSDDPAAPAAFSYYARRAETPVNTGRTPDRPSNAVLERASRNRQRRRVVYTSMAGLIALLFLISVLTPHAKLVMESTPASKPLLKSDAQYSQAADQAVSDSLLNRSKLTLNASRIDTELLGQFPELSDVHVSAPVIGSKPVVTLTAATPALQLMTGNGGTFVIDTTGKAVVLVSNVSNPAALHLPLVVDKTNLPVKLGQPALSESSVAFMREIVAQLAAKHVNVSKLTLPAAANEIDASLQGRAYTVKFNTQSSSARQQAGTFLAVVTRLDKLHTQPSQYVDVRVEGRAYYK